MGVPQAKTEAAAQKEALVREMLERVGDKWTLLVVEELGSGGEMRFTELRDRIGGVSQKMLTKTLRALERDGLVTRRVHPVVPPRVDYKLTKLGEALGEAVVRHLDLGRKAREGRRAIAAGLRSQGGAKARGARRGQVDYAANLPLSAIKRAAEAAASGASTRQSGS